MKNFLLFLAIAVALSHSFFAQEAADKSDFPVTLPRLVNVLKGKQLKDSQIISVIKTNGVSFELIPETEKELKKYKASPGIIEAIRQNFVPSAGGILNGKAINLVRPAYPNAARGVNASGTVNVQIVIDQNGNVTVAQAVSGHLLLRQAAEQAARASTFAPTKLRGRKVKVTGIIVYNFVK